MKTIISLSVSLFLSYFICMGCSHSQHLLVNQREFSEEMSKLKVGSKLSVNYGSDPKYSGILVEPVSILSDSSHVIIIETSQSEPWQQLLLSPTASPGVLTQISIRATQKQHALWMVH